MDSGSPKVLDAPKSWRDDATYLESLLGNPWYRLIYKLLGQTSVATHRFFEFEGANCALMPITTGSVSSPMGLGSDSFPVDVEMNGEKTYLADSMQFYLELALRIDQSPAYYLMPSFRDEEADARHLNQFFHAEAEIIGGLSDVQALVERYMLFLARHMISTCQDEIFAVAGTLDHIESFVKRGTSFPSLTFAQAVQYLQDMPDAFEMCETGDLTITTAGERALIAKYGDFIWLTHMPMSTVPFYQAVNPEDETLSLSADLLAGIGEVLGSGQRARTFADVMTNIDNAQVNPDHYTWYTKMKRLNDVQTAGFGLGIERFLMWITGTNDIRDWSLLPRDRHGKGPV